MTACFKNHPRPFTVNPGERCMFSYLQHFAQCLLRLDGGLLAEGGVPPAAQAASQLRANLDLVHGSMLGQRLRGGGRRGASRKPMHPNRPSNGPVIRLPVYRI